MRIFKKRRRSSLTLKQWEAGKTAALDLLRAELAGARGDFAALDQLGVTIAELDRAALEAAIYTNTGLMVILVQETARLNDMEPEAYLELLDPTPDALGC